VKWVCGDNVRSSMLALERMAYLFLTRKFKIFSLGVKSFNNPRENSWGIGVLRRIAYLPLALPLVEEPKQE
jgi:hypothetical protein